MLARAAEPGRAARDGGQDGAGTIAGGMDQAIFIQPRPSSVRPLGKYSAETQPA